MGSIQLIAESLFSSPIIRCYPGMRGYQTVPDRAVGVTVASPASANAYGTSTQITAGLPYDAYLVGVLLGNAGVGAGDNYTQLGIDLGPATAVRTIAELQWPGHYFNTASAGNFGQTPVMLPFPVLVPAGVRIAAKVARSAPTAINYLVHLLLVPVAEVTTLENISKGRNAGANQWPEFKELPAIRTIGSGRGSSMIPAASLAVGAACAAGATPAYGAYVTVAAAIPYDYLITHIVFGLLGTTGQTFVQCGLGIGAAGAEYSISDIVLLRETAVTAIGETTWQPVTLPIGLLVPAGSRLAARIAASTSALAGDIDVNGVYDRNLSPGPGLG